MNFESLVGHINQVQDVLQAQAAHAVNLSLTARNWLVGYYIVEFEQHGEDRAKYGDNLLNRLAQSINKKGFSPRRLREYRQFYLVYPVLGVEVEKYIENTSTKLLNSGASSIWRLSTAKLQASENQADGIWRSATAKLNVTRDRYLSQSLIALRPRGEGLFLLFIFAPDKIQLWKITICKLL